MERRKSAVLWAAAASRMLSLRGRKSLQLMPGTAGGGRLQEQLGYPHAGACTWEPAIRWWVSGGCVQVTSFALHWASPGSPPTDYFVRGALWKWQGCIQKEHVDSSWISSVSLILTFVRCKSSKQIELANRAKTTCQMKSTSDRNKHHGVH